MQELIQTINHQIVVESKKYDEIKKNRSDLDMQGIDSTSLYFELQESEKEIKRLTNYRDTLLKPENYERVEKLKKEWKEATTAISRDIAYLKYLIALQEISK